MRSPMTLPPEPVPPATADPVPSSMAIPDHMLTRQQMRWRANRKAEIEINRLSAELTRLKAEREEMLAALENLLTAKGYSALDEAEGIARSIIARANRGEI